MTASIRLSIRRGDQEVASVIAGEQPVRIGRSRQCDVVLEDAAVSRVHAVLTIDGGQPVLTDQNSQNGLWVRGTRVARVVLDPSVVVAMGPFRILCETAEMPATADGTILRRPAPGQTPVPTSVPEPVTPTPMAGTAASSGTHAAASGEVAAAGPATVVPPGGRDSGGKTTATAPITRLSGPQISPAATKSATAQTVTLLVVAGLIMIVVGGASMALWLKWRSGSRAAASGVAQSDAVTSVTPTPPPATTTSVEVATTSAPAPDAGAPTSSDAAAAGEPGAAAPGAPGGTEGGAAGPDAGRGGPDAGRGAALPPGIIAAGRREKESNQAWKRRSTELTARLTQAKAALDKGDLATAIDLLTMLNREEPNFGDAPALLARARDAQKANALARAAAAFDEGQQKEGRQDFNGAVQSYQQAERLDADVAAKAAAAIAAARGKQKALVDELVKNANAEFSFRPARAIPLYQQALKVMADDDPRRADVQAKLAQLGIKQ
jgi:FHA domain-containing protein